MSMLFLNCSLSLCLTLTEPGIHGLEQTERPINYRDPFVISDPRAGVNRDFLSVLTFLCETRNQTQISMLSLKTRH